MRGADAVRGEADLGLVEDGAEQVLLAGASRDECDARGVVEDGELERDAARGRLQASLDIRDPAAVC